MSNLRTCNACGWVHFGVTRSYAEAEIARFAAYFDTLSRQQQLDWYGGKGATLENYDRCFRCGGPWQNTRPAVADDVPYGSTIQPILIEDDP